LGRTTDQEEEDAPRDDVNVNSRLLAEPVVRVLVVDLKASADEENDNEEQRLLFQAKNASEQ
jgi:hypothetical protein